MFEDVNLQTVIGTSSTLHPTTFHRQRMSFCGKFHDYLVQISSANSLIFWNHLHWHQLVCNIHSQGLLKLKKIPSGKFKNLKYTYLTADVPMYQFKYVQVLETIYLV